MIFGDGGAVHNFRMLREDFPEEVTFREDFPEEVTFQSELYPQISLLFVALLRRCALQMQEF